MDWIRQSAGDASARQARRLVFVIPASAGAMVLAIACVACGQVSVASPNITTPNAGGSGGSAIPSAGGSGGSGCPTQGVGGDTVPPVCVAPVSAAGPPISGPASLTATPPTSPPAAPLPVVTGISPASGAAGTSVTITGSGLGGATGVSFGGAAAQFTIDSDTQITATSPPGSGTVDVTVVTPGGTSATSPADQFSYQG